MQQRYRRGNNIFFFYDFVLIICFFLSSTSFAFTKCIVQDDERQTIVFKKPAKRIISLAPHLTELLFSAGAGKEVVGVDSASDYPPEVRNIPKVAGYTRIDVERVLRLKPDLILTWRAANYRGDLEQLKKAGIPVFSSDPQMIQDIPNTIKKIGCMTSHLQTSKNKADQFIKRYVKLKHNAKKKQHPKVFVQIWSSPLMTISNKSFMNHAIQLCGGENIFAQAPIAAPQVNLEAVIARNPDVIIGTQDIKELKKYWQRFKMISAVKRDIIFVLKPDLIARPGPRFLEGALQLCEKLIKINNEKNHVILTKQQHEETIKRLNEIDAILEQLDKKNELLTVSNKINMFTFQKNLLYQLTKGKNGIYEKFVKNNLERKTKNLNKCVDLVMDLLENLWADIHNNFKYLEANASSGPNVLNISDEIKQSVLSTIDFALRYLNVHSTNFFLSKELERLAKYLKKITNEINEHLNQVVIIEDYELKSNFNYTM